MNKLKFVGILWGITLISLLIILTCIGKTYLRKIEPYERMEHTLANSAKTYVDNELDLVKGQTIIKLEELQEANYIKNLKVNNDKCTGYVVVDYQKNAKEYTGYITCQNYKTKGYKNNE